MLIPVLELLAGFAILTAGGHFMVRGAVSIALLSGLSTAVVGLTVVAFGTSLPELAVSVNAAANGSTDIAYANVVGSSIFNITVILGVTALFRPVIIARETRTIDYPSMLATLGLCLFMARDRLISQLEGSVLLLGLLVFLTLTYLRTRAAPPAPSQGPEWDVPLRTDGSPAKLWVKSLGMVLLGVVALWAGSEFMVRGAVSIAQSWGISERVIGLTIIAMGTSLPELTTSVMAARQGEDEIAFSNLMGSNIFNVLAVLGVTSLMFPVPVHPQAAALDNWVMLASGVVLFPILWTSPTVNRWHGTALLAGFLVFFGVLVGGG